MEGGRKIGMMDGIGMKGDMDIEGREGRRGWRVKWREDGGRDGWLGEMYRWRDRERDRRMKGGRAEEEGGGGGGEEEGGGRMREGVREDHIWGRDGWTDGGEE